MRPSRSLRTLLAAALIGAAAPALAAGENTNWPNYREGDFVDYRFTSSETLPQLKLHYRTLGTAERNAAGEIVNGVLLLQGNTGTGANWLRSSLADELFKPGQPLDVGRYFIIIPDALGRGGSSKPSDGLKGKFPHYRYRDMIDSAHRLVTEGLKVGHLRLVIGSSLGCMHSFLWAETYPELMGELSYRRGLSEGGGKLAAEWCETFARHSDRFLLGSDTWINERWFGYDTIMQTYRGWLAQE